MRPCQCIKKTYQCAQRYDMTNNTVFQYWNAWTGHIWSGWFASICVRACCQWVIAEWPVSAKKRDGEYKKLKKQFKEFYRIFLATY